MTPPGTIRPWRAAAIAVACVLMVGSLISCSSSAQAPKATEAADPAFPVSIDHKFGSTTITSRPTRVVTVGWNDQDFALALGVVPVSTREWFEEYLTYPWVKTALG